MNAIYVQSLSSKTCFVDGYDQGKGFAFVGKEKKEENETRKNKAGQ